MQELSPEVLEQIKAGSLEAFAELVRLYQSRVRAFLGGFLHSPEIVDDLAQETFVQAFKAMGRYRGESSLCTWLLGIGRNLALNHLRAEQHRRQRDQQWWAERVAFGLAHDEAATPERSGRMIEALIECVNGLPGKSAELVRGFYFERRKGETLAASLGLTVNALRQRLARIREGLHACVMSKIEASDGAL